MYFRPVDMFQQKSFNLQGDFSKELQKLFTSMDAVWFFAKKPSEDGNSFAETYVGVSNTFYVCQ